MPSSPACQQGARHRYAVLAESVGAGGQIGVEPSSLFGVKGGEHPLLHGGDGRGGADEALGACVGEGEVLVAAGAIALDKVGASQRAQELVHCLTGDERATCECGVGEPGSVGELFQTRVLRDGQIVVSQGCVHRGPQGGRRAFEHVANGRIEIDLTHVNILTYPGRQDIDKRIGVFPMPVGPDFISLQVRDLDTAAAFYEDRVGLRRAPASPPGAVVFASEPIPFAVREPLPDTDLDSGQPGLGIALWLKVDDAQALHDQLAGRGVTILTDPFDGPFGRTFALRDPDGYAVTIHDAA
jgi:predicted enzyme related to lactoylglutathione lyase